MKIEDTILSEFLEKVYRKYGYDFRNYNYGTLKRRINNHAIKISIDDFDSYSNLILNNKLQFNEMFTKLSINVTQFFREPDQLKIFREKVIPYLKTFTHIKIWCAGSSSGESPYSMAIILKEEGILDKSQIYATDFNNIVLKEAKEGLFDIDNFIEDETNYKISGGKYSFSNYFIKYGKYYKIKKYLKEHILFFNHNLATDSVMNEFQLIVCKNVIIYFNMKLKEDVFKLFDNSLVCNGFLILGNSEYLPNKFESKFKHYLSNSKIYHKDCSKNLKI